MRPEPEFTDFGARLWQAGCHAKCETKADLARKLGVRRQQVHKWLHRDQDVTSQVALKMSKILRVNHIWLISGAGDMIDPSAPSEIQALLMEIHDSLPSGWREEWIEHGRRIAERLAGKKKP